MALYRFEAKIVSRSGGRSSVGSAAYRTGKCATASAAYRAGAAMKDERTGQVFDYTRMRGVLGAEILLPSGAPEWMRDRGQLWNAIEKVEKRHDAQLARDFVISLPFELPHEERVALTRSFVEHHFVSKGFVADVAWHSPERGGDRRNFHAHVMVTLRRALENGFSRTKDRAPGRLHPMQHWKQELERLRVAWAEFGAAALTRAGLHVEAARFRDGHMTLAKQREAAIARGDHAWAEQLDREAEPKQGPLATKMEREGHGSLAGADRRAAKERGAELSALKAEHAAITAEIIDLELERTKRGHMETANEETAAQQPRRESALLSEAKVREAELIAFRQRKEAEAEEARRREEERRKSGATIQNGDIDDPRRRYTQALGENYDVRDPYGSLARTAMAEHALFAKQQQDYRRQEAAEPDAERRKLIQLAREIEANDYMAITSERLAGISRVVAGPDAARRAKAEGRATQAELDDARARSYGERARTLREERVELVHAREERAKAERERSGDIERKVAGPGGELTDSKQERANRLAQLSDIGETYARHRAERGPRSRGRSR